MSPLSVNVSARKTYCVYSFTRTAQNTPSLITITVCTGIYHTWVFNISFFSFQLYRAIFGSNSTITKVQELCKDHGKKAIDALQIFNPSDARNALEKIIQALTTFPVR
jgi:geranylgeranyl pyrophosphate synthase